MSTGDDGSEKPEHLASTRQTQDNTDEYKNENDQPWYISWYDGDDSIENPEAPSHELRLERLPESESEESSKVSEDESDLEDDPEADLDYYFSQPEPDCVIHPVSWRIFHAKRMIHMSFWDYDVFDCRDSPDRDASNANMTVEQLIEEEIDSILDENRMTKETVFITILAQIYLEIAKGFRRTCVELEEKFTDDSYTVEQGDGLSFTAEGSTERLEELSYYRKLAAYCTRRYRECMRTYCAKLAAADPGAKRKRYPVTMTHLEAPSPLQIKRPRASVI